jgi:hypothetical protein
MALNITQQELHRTDLVVLVGRDGIVQWSASRSREQVVAMLRSIADSIEDGTL